MSIRSNWHHLDLYRPGVEIGSGGITEHTHRYVSNPFSAGGKVYSKQTKVEDNAMKLAFLKAASTQKEKS
jgi:hypothetical protein